MVLCPVRALSTLTSVCREAQAAASSPCSPVRAPADSHLRMEKGPGVHAVRDAADTRAGWGPVRLLGSARKAAAPPVSIPARLRLFKVPSQR